MAASKRKWVIEGHEHGRRGRTNGKVAGSRTRSSGREVDVVPSKPEAPSFPSLARQEEVASPPSALTRALLLAAAGLPPKLIADVVDFPPEMADAFRQHITAFLEMHGFSSRDNVEYAGPWSGPAMIEGYLGISRQALAKKRRVRSLLGVPFRNGKFYYPTRQFRDGAVLPGLKDVLDALSVGDDDPETWALWMAGQPADGERTNWDELRDGNVDLLVMLARRDAARWAA